MNKVEKIMIKEVEKIVREKVASDFDTSKNKNRKSVSNEIVKKLDEVMINENKKT